jgi:cytochrome c oxidase subunit 1
MVFFVLTAALSGTFSNLLIPLQIGARDMASGFMNMISYYSFIKYNHDFFYLLNQDLQIPVGLFIPLSALPQAIGGSRMGMTLWLISMAIFIASSLMGSLNYIVTVINLRTKGIND